MPITTARDAAQIRANIISVYSGGGNHIRCRNDRRAAAHYSNKYSIKLKSLRKNCFARERTTKATVITKKQNFHTTKKRTLTVQHRFYFFDIRNTKRVIQV